MSNPVKQHIIPEFYLKYFTNTQGYLAVYDSEQDKFFEPQKPCNTGYKKHAYTIETPDSTKDYNIELALSQIEGIAKPILDKLIAQKRINSREKSYLSLFFALLYQRTLKYFNYMEDFINVFNKSTLKLINSTDKEIIDKNKDIISKLEQSPTKNQILSLSFGNIELTNMLKNVFEKQNWTIFVVPKEFNIITTDAPVIEDYSNVTEIIKSFPTANKIIPLSANMVLCVAKRGSRFKYLKVQDEEQIKGLNTVIYINRNRFIYSKNQNTIEELKGITKNFKRTCKITSNQLS